MTHLLLIGVLRIIFFFCFIKYSKSVSYFYFLSLLNCLLLVTTPLLVITVKFRLCLCLSNKVGRLYKVVYCNKRNE
jgi:hypothetical protein